MKLKYTGIYAPESSWVEYFYHDTVVVTNGVAETESETSIEMLKQMGFVPLKDWEKQEAERQEIAAADEAKRLDEYVKQREADEKNAAETLENDTTRTKKEQKEHDKLVAQSEGEKPLFPVEEGEASVDLTAAHPSGTDNGAAEEADEDKD